MRTRFPALVLFGTLCVVFSGCRDREVTSYRIPKEKETPLQPPTASAPANPEASAASAPMAAGPSTMANTAVPTATGPDLTWTAPTNWQLKGPAPMRKATYIIPSETGGAPLELSITAFPNSTGGETANLNRWRGQLQLQPAAEGDLEKDLTRFEQGGLKFTVADYDNGQNRMVGAIVPFNGGTWFFKLTGPTAAIAKEKTSFLDFLKTVKAPVAP